LSIQIGRIVTISRAVILQSVAMAPSLRDPFFANAVRSNINSSRVLALMSQINWDVHEMKDMHNPYVDVLLRVCILLPIHLIY
jgi:hypothetical protein